MRQLGGRWKHKEMTDRKLIDSAQGAKRLGEVRLELFDNSEERLIRHDANRHGGGSPARNEGFGVGAGGLYVVD